MVGDRVIFEEFVQCWKTWWSKNDLNRTQPKKLGHLVISSLKLEVHQNLTINSNFYQNVSNRDVPLSTVLADAEFGEPWNSVELEFGRYLISDWFSWTDIDSFYYSHVCFGFVMVICDKIYGFRSVRINQI